MGESSPDGALAAKAMKGDQAAFGQLMAAHRDAVFRLVRAHVADADEALDLTQETFIAAFASLSQFDQSRPFRAWVLRIALNKCRDWGRRRAVRRFFTYARPLDDAAHVADVAPLADAQMEETAALETLRAEIAALPESLREPLILCALEQLSQAEAARILRISEKAVEMRLYRARAHLAERLRVSQSGGV